MLMEKTSPPTTTTATTPGKAGMTGMTSETLSKVADILQCFGTSDPIPSQFDSKGFHSDFIRGLLKTHRVDRGRISSLLSVKHPVLAELTVDASVIRSGKSLTLIAVEFKAKGTGKLVFTSQATFYHMPVASL